MFLEKINAPEDLKKLDESALNLLASEMRTALLKKLSDHGGHIGPNLGMIEATIALHYVFNSPRDKIVFDVSHQSYAHKMLTGRRTAFINPENYDDVSGYTNPKESEHDFFNIGHTSTSISLASGLAKARDLKDENHNVVAVIGDGSLSGGEALEGLDFAGELGTNFIIVVNDNQMSIAENHGGLYKNLKILRESNGTAECNFFKAFGLDYIYVDHGNDIATLIAAFRSVKNSPKPVVVHINTIKGKGYAFAENEKEPWHWGVPFDLETGKSKINFDGESYSDLTANFLLEKMKTDSNVVAITAGTPTVFGFTPERRAHAGAQFLDVGIAEEHAIALASGIAAGGGKPVFGVFSTFIQRTYDQISQDLCVNKNPATILVFLGSLSGFNDVTHLGFFDIPIIANIPNMVYLAPTNREEYFAMLEWSLHQNEHPVAIRVPANGVISCKNASIETDFSKINHYKITQMGMRVAVLALGSFYQLGENVVAKLKSEINVNATLINPRFVSGVDTALLEKLKENHELVITLEDGILDGGFGEKISRFYGSSKMKVLNFGAKKEFADRFILEDFLKENHLTTPQIIEDIKTTLLNI